MAATLGALIATTRPARTGATKPPGALARAGGALRYGFREYRRNLALWVLLIGVPLFLHHRGHRHHP